MTFSTGTKLGPYEIVAPLGAGGMGEVYRARDLNLKREVAIKVLPDAFVRDADREARFQREAEVLAALNHPHIAAIHDLAHFGESRLLVMELVEGDTLADRVARGPIPIEEALEIARQIAEALEAAHEKGIIHRDLKPANVKITPEGKVKVLDFGLAKALDGAPANMSLSNSPTLSPAATSAGVIIGTAAYMSPEQARGLAVDARSDVFSFGAVLYEMLTGRQAFQGEMVSDILASVLKSDPDMSQLPAKLSPTLHKLLRRALEKNPKRRWHAVGDVRLEIEAILADPRGELVEEQRSSGRKPLWKRAIPVVLAAVIAAAIGSFAAWNLKPAASATVTRFPISLPEDQQFTNNRFGNQLLAVSPDGTGLVYVANSNLFFRSMTETEARPLLASGGDTVSNVFFSPDGQWVGFRSFDSTLKKIAITGGVPLTIAKADPLFGASWDGDQIVFGQGPKGIMRVSANGGEPEVLAKVQPPEIAHGPQMLDGGRVLLFTLTTESGVDRWDKGQIVVQSLSSGERKVVIRGGSDARYLPTGHLVYAFGGTLFAVPFDLDSLQVQGASVPVVEGVRRATNPQAEPATAQVAFSNTGSMVYIPGLGVSSQRALVLTDQAGKAQPLPLPPGEYSSPRISPDGKQLVVATDDGEESIVWIHDLNGNGSLRRLTFGGRNLFPIWSRDGRYITFQSDREGARGLFRQLADGSGPAERLTKAEQGVSHVPEAWSPDGKTLSFHVARTGSGGIWTVSPDGDNIPRPFVEIPGSLQANSVFSPDGRWLAYSSSESTVSPRVFVQPFPGTGAKYQISTEISTAPVWSPDGRQLFYHLAGPSMVAVDIRTTPSFTFGSPRPLPIDGFLNPSQTVRYYDITPDGKQFILVSPDAALTDLERRASPQINVVLNWFEELRQRVPLR